MKKLITALLSLTLLGSAALFAQEPTVKDDTKQVGKSVSHAAKKVGHKTKKTTKKVVHKSAKETRKGAEKVEKKSKPNP